MFYKVRNMDRGTTRARNFAEYLTVGEAAQFLGVSPATLRNWDRSGKLKPRRHPQNGYRIYLHEDLQSVLSSAGLSAPSGTLLAPKSDWSAMGESEHFVQFYESDEYLIESIDGFVQAALTTGNSSVVVATAEHRLALQRKLAAGGVDVADAMESGRYVVLDAAAMLAKFMADGAPNAQRFRDTIGPVIAQLAEGGRRVHAFGEMVALLWADGNRDGAIRLEELWNDLGREHRFVLFCAYPMACFGDANDADPFNGLCGCHSRVIPTETYAAIDDVDERLRAISNLQQKAQSLEAEIAHRRHVERALSNREHQLADFFEKGADALPKTVGGGTRPTTRSKQRILVVDDNRDACNTLGMLLRLQGHDVRTAHDGLQAVEVVEDFEPRIILMDVGMPKLDGYEATRRIRQLPSGKDAFIVALTGWTRTSDRELSADAGCSAHLVKPVDFAALERLLASEFSAS
jgi:CheY-like chemotaxis protein